MCDLSSSGGVEEAFGAPKAHSVEDYTAFELNNACDSLNMLNAVVVPRPIAFVTSHNAQGCINAAPFSYFNVVCTNPALISIAIERRQGSRKDTALNILYAREFVVNICSIELAKVISVASGDFSAEISEIELTGLTLIPSDTVAIPRIAHCPAHLECQLFQHIEVGDNQCDLFLGRVTKLHVKKHLVNNGMIDIAALNPLVRAGALFGKVGDYFYIPRGLEQ